MATSIDTAPVYYLYTFQIWNFMRLSEFMLDNLEPIVQEWENFARILTSPGEPLDVEALRDHAEEMLRTIAEDLNTKQSQLEQLEKSQGLGDPQEATAAKTHAITRLMSGFTIDQLVAEFRALRASVIKLWLRQESNPELQLEDMVRFNEAIDQALAESIVSYTKEVQVSRNVFLGILGHDLRTPLNAILLGSEVLLQMSDLDARPTKIASRIYTSVKRASQIVGDLLDFTRSHLGSGIPLSREVMDIRPVCERIVEELRTVHPEADIQFEPKRSVIGLFDGARLEQVFSNLIGNAIQHGDQNAPIKITLDSDRDTALFSVHNTGDVISKDVVPLIFSPMGRYSSKHLAEKGPQSGLGLGLFISAQIVDCHGGSIEVTSNAEAGTTFAITFPLRAI
jgi:signal transduction histidine kinase